MHSNQATNLHPVICLDSWDKVEPYNWTTFFEERTSTDRTQESTQARLLRRLGIWNSIPSRTYWLRTTTAAMTARSGNLSDWFCRCRGMSTEMRDLTLENMWMLKEQTSWIENRSIPSPRCFSSKTWWWRRMTAQISCLRRSLLVRTV